MKRGFTLIELILVIAILSLLVSVALFITYPSYDKIRFQITIKKLDALVKGIIGDERLISSGTRVDFGFVGDTNSLPNTLDDLVTNPGISGWNGPYVQREYGEDPEGYKKDGWGNYFVYNRINGTIISYGSDGAVGGTGYAADITRKIYDPLDNLSNNNIRVYVKDKNDTTLTDAHVSVSISLPSGSQDELKYTLNGYFERLTETWIGNYDIKVTPTGPYAPYLGSPIISRISVYPKGSSSYSSCIVKFPTYIPVLPIPIQLTFLSAGASTTYYTQWTNMPNALTELFGNTNYRLYYDLTNASSARLLVYVVTAGTSTAYLRVQYSIDGTNWYYLDGTNGPAVSIATTGLKVSNWVNITQAGKTNVYLRVVGNGGDGVADPRFSNICLQIR